jgi:hypothetical protein
MDWTESQTDKDVRSVCLAKRRRLNSVWIILLGILIFLITEAMSGK